MRVDESMEGAVRQLRQQFDEQAEAHRPDLWRYCYRLTGSAWDAEDLVQETLTRAFARLARFWQPLEIRPYLFRVASNAYIDSLRSARVETAELAEPVAPVPDPLETWGAVESLVELLPPRQRVVVLLTQVFAFTNAEAGAMLHMTEGAVKAALHRARATLKSASRRDAPVSGSRLAPDQSAVVSRYLDAFNRRDPAAIAALLDADVTGEIVGVATELGRETVERNSLAEWAADPQFMWAEAGQLEGRPVLFVFCRTDEHERALSWIVTLGLSEDRVTAVGTYFYTPELISHAAAQLGIPAVSNGYRYVAPQ